MSAGKHATSGAKRVLHVNKYLYRRGGAEAYMLDLADIQRVCGYEVACFGMAHPDNPDLPYEECFPTLVELGESASRAMKARGLARMLYSTSSRRGLQEVLERFEPDVVHFHNIYHQLSPSLLGAVTDAHIPAVMTVHDYKLICPSYKMLDHGQPCDACLDGRFRHAVQRRCMKDSLVSSVAVALETRLHRSTGAYEPVQQFICPSRFLADQMTKAGVFADRLQVVPHFVDAGAVTAKDRPGGPFVYAGRLSAEKGIDVFLEAAGRLPACRVEVAGDGPERERLESVAARFAPGRVRFHGRLTKGALQNLVRSSTASVLPSQWYENQPIAALESFALGVPVVATHLGGLPEVVTDGVDGTLVPPRDANALADALEDLATNPERALAMGHAGRRKVLAEFSVERHLAALAAVYEKAAQWPGP